MSGTCGLIWSQYDCTCVCRLPVDHQSPHGWTKCEPSPSLEDQANLWRLLREAPDPGPWLRKWASLDVHGLTGDDVLLNQRNIDLAVAAVNALPDLLRRAYDMGELVGVSCDYDMGVGENPCDLNTGHKGPHHSRARTVTVEEAGDPPCNDCERTHPWRDHSDPTIEAHPTP